VNRAIGPATSWPDYAKQESGVDILATLSPFWIIGIVVNLTLTGLAAWWVIRNMRARKPSEHESGADPERGERG
jgi:hypothetical protein